MLSLYQWKLLADAEKPLYNAGHGTHAYTSVIPREEANLAYLLWDAAVIAVDAEIVEDPQDWGPTQERACARRVAAALAVVSFGTEFLLKL